MHTTTVRADDLPLVLAAAKLRRRNAGRTCQLAALSAGPVIQLDCRSSSRWTRPGLRDDARRLGLSPARVMPMQRGHQLQVHLTPAVVPGEHRKALLVCVNCHKRFHTELVSGHDSASTQ